MSGERMVPMSERMRDAVEHAARWPSASMYDVSALKALVDAFDAASPAASDDPKLTHGRHCPCSVCAAEDWTNPALAPCGMHGPSCPREYRPIVAERGDDG